MTIKSWPAAERPRERLLARGREQPCPMPNCSRYCCAPGLPGRSAVDLARELLGAFGDLRRLLDAEPAAFCAHAWARRGDLAHLQAALELSRRYLLSRISRGRALGSPGRGAGSSCNSRCAACRTRCSPACSSTTSTRVISYEELFRGTIDGASVYPREIVQALRWPSMRPR